MATRLVNLTNTPQPITSKAAYIESVDGEFRFAFSPTIPTNLSVSHKDRKLYSDGSLGPLYVWKSTSSELQIIVSEAT